MPDLRVFISSTFRDLQEEREHLVKKIFPEIRALCRERGIIFTEVDLRWGLTDEDVALGQVIRTCLEEVDKCRPYFIGITGDRYGFVPTYLDIHKDPALLDLHPWIEDAALDGMSITEMEAHYAVIGRAEGGEGKGALETARFYFRRRRESLDDVHQENDEHSRLEAYQQRIRQSGAVIETFRDPASLGELIYDDLVKIIKRDFADARPPTPLQLERARHDAFSLSRRRAYIPNPTYLKRLNDHATSDDPPLVVYAESGSGKSSLFAYWADQYRRKNPGAHVIEHYVGIGATAADHYAVIRHVCMEIKERFGRDEEIPSENDKLEAVLGQWLGYADHELRKGEGGAFREEGGRRSVQSDINQVRASSSDSSLIPPPSSLVIILDGLNQLQGDALNLRWIPDIISPSIRLILSSTVEGTLVELTKRGWGRFGMQALMEAERETIVVRYLAEYHKSLNPEQIKRLATDYKCGHPLFLKTVLEELRLVSRHEDLDWKINSYLEVTGTEDLFQRVLERLEEDYNMRAVRDVMSLLCASRSGLDEQELSDLSRLARLKIATMMAGLDYHLVRKEGRLTFFHDYLRRAVEKRYLADENKKRSTHLGIAEYFQSVATTSIAADTAVSARVAGELCYQLHSGGAIDRLRDSLSSIPVFLALYNATTHYEVRSYWSEIREGVDVVQLYRRGLADWRTTDTETRSRGMHQIVLLLEKLGEWSGAIELARQRLASLNGSDLLSEEADSHLILGRMLFLHNDYDEAMVEFERALELYTTLNDRFGIGKVVGNMGVVYSRRGDYDRAMESYQLWERACEEAGDRPGMSAAIAHMGIVYSRRGEYDAAMELVEKSLRLSEAAGIIPDASDAIANMGVVYFYRGEYDRAIECYERHLRICESLGDRNGIASAIGNIGVVYDMRGEYDRAIACYERQLSVCEVLGNRTEAATAIGNMGIAYMSIGDYERALQMLFRAADEHGAVGHSEAEAAWLNRIADVLLEIIADASSGDAAGHAEIDQRSMPEFLSTWIPNDDLNRWETRALEKAQACTIQSIAISEKVSNPDAVLDGRIVLARIDAARGNVDQAVERLREMRAEMPDEVYAVEVDYWLWRIDGAADPSAMLRVYEQLYAEVPNHEYRKRIDELKRAIGGS